MCECSQSPPKTVSKLTFDSKMTKNEIERPQMGGGVFVAGSLRFFGYPRLVWTPASQAPCGCARLTSSTKRPAASGRQAGKNVHEDLAKLLVQTRVSYDAYKWLHGRRKRILSIFEKWSSEIAQTFAESCDPAFSMKSSSLGPSTKKLIEDMNKRFVP